MREYHVITSPLTFLAVLKLEMVSEVNQHGLLTLTGYIKDKQEQDYLNQLTGEVWEKVELAASGAENEILFYGLVTDFSIETVNDQKKMSLTLKTGSCLLDVKKHLRSFQDPAVTYQQIFQGIMKEYREGVAIFNSSFEDREKELILQYEETDWDFLKRLASRKHKFLIPEVKRRGSKLFYDLPIGKEFEFPGEGKYSVRKDLDEYREKRACGLEQMREGECLIYILHGRQPFRIGDFTIVGGRKLYLYKICCHYERGELLYKSYLKLAGGLLVPTFYQKDMTGASLDGIVYKVKEDKVQIEIAGDENKGQKIDMWFPYATVYSTADGTGWYCMPEPGDRVRLTIPGIKEKEAFITSSVHLETESRDRLDPSHKIFKSKYQKEVRFTPDSIIITNNKGTKIELTDQEGIHIVSAHSVMLEAAEDLFLSSDTGSLIAAGTESVSLRQRGTAINLDDGITFTGGELKVQ